MNRFVLTVLSRPVATFIAFLALAGAGILAAFRTPLDFLPRMEVPQITVATSFPGLPAADIRELVSIPLEDALSGLGGLKRIRSYSRDGSSLIQLTLDWGSPMAVAALRAREIIDVAYLSLPSQAEKPLVLPVDPGEEPVLLLGVFTREGRDPSLVRELADREIRSALQQVKGVGSLQVSGGRRELIEIKVDQSCLGRTGQSLSDLADAVGAMNAEYPSGSLDDGDTRYIIKTDGRRESWEELADIVLPPNGESGTVRIRDVATVEKEPEERRAFLLSTEGEGIALSVRRNRGFSPVSLSKNIRSRLPALNAAYHQDLEIRVLYDASVEISTTVRRMLYSGLLGAAAAFFILWLFLKRLVYAGITLTAIPLSILGTMAALRLMDITLNIMSLGGLTLGIGMLVDNSVVVLENLVRKASGRDKHAISAATSEITDSTLGSTLTSVVVFLPLLFLPGLLGELFSDMAWAIVFSLAFSLLVSAAWIPLLFSFTPRDCRPATAGVAAPYLRRMLRWVLRRPAAGFCAAAALLAAALALVPGFGFHWLEPTRQSRIDVILNFPSGTRVEHLFDTAEDLLGFLESRPGILFVTVTGGGDTSDPYFLADPERRTERMDVMVFTDSESKWTPATMENLLENRISERYGVSLDIRYPPDLLSRVMSLNEGRSRLVVPSDEPALAVLTARGLIEHVGGDSDIHLIPDSRKPQLQLIPDRQALSRYGLTLSPLSSLVGTAMNGRVVSAFEESGRRIPIRVRMREEDRRNRSALMGITVLNTDGGPVALGELTQLVERED
ncbi:MAG: efflux RND transporter permease subunit, partial [Spirochaetaceae bacterium]|nr:efflux RND transporter permease subunit [Spirochaetaceae bacterium]